jgi:cytochrome d oxidase subunit CydB
MHTPQGFEVVDGRFVPVDMLQVIFTPSFPYRLAHALCAFVVTAGFVVLAVGAGYLRRERHPAEARVMVKMGLGFLAVMVPLQIVLGDLHGLNTLKHQPAKVAAMEGLWDTGTHVAASIVAWPDEAAERNRLEISVPGLASLYLTHDWQGEIKGLKEWPRQDRPPMAIVYWAFRLMVGIGFLMLAVVALGLWQAWRGRLYLSALFLRAAQASLPLGFVAVLAGWTVTEVGRQPWVVYGHLRTADAVTPSLSTADVAASLAVYVVAYLIIFGGGLLLLRRLVQRGPDLAAAEDEQQGARGAEDSPQRPMRPLSASRPHRSHRPTAQRRSPTMPADGLALDLVPIWAAILALAVFMYVLLDGFDLGVGMLFALRKDANHRDIMVGTVAPVWDFNETWLILGGGGLLAVFPLAFAILMPALYFPILGMLMGLLFRGVAFEYREVGAARRGPWDHGFFWGSLVATFAQGVILGNFIQGVAVQGRHFAGGSWDWVNPFALLTGLGLIAGYALQGATWLVMKTEGELQAWARRVALRCLVGVLLFIALISLWTPLTDTRIAERWFSLPNLWFLAPVPLLTAGIAVTLWRSLNGRGEVLPFLCSIGLFVLSFSGLAISLWPYLIPPVLTLWDAAAAPKSQAFVLVGTLFLLPVLLMYVAWSYWVFRGKVREGQAYHG